MYQGAPKRSLDFFDNASKMRLQPAGNVHCPTAALRMTGLCCFFDSVRIALTSSRHADPS